MKIFKDVLTGDEMLSDTFQMTSEYDDAILKVPSKNRPKDVLDADVGCGNAFGGGEEEEQQAPPEGVEMVLDVVANSELKQVNMSKKEFMAYIKDYFKKLIAYRKKMAKKTESKDSKKEPKLLSNSSFLILMISNFILELMEKMMKEKLLEVCAFPIGKMILLPDPCSTFSKMD